MVVVEYVLFLVIVRQVVVYDGNIDEPHTCINGARLFRKNDWCNLHRWECHASNGCVTDCATYIYEHARCGSRGRDPITHGDQCLTWCPEGSVVRDHIDNSIVYQNGQWMCAAIQDHIKCGP